MKLPRRMARANHAHTDRCPLCQSLSLLEGRRVSPDQWRATTLRQRRTNGEASWHGRHCEPKAANGALCSVLRLPKRELKWESQSPCRGTAAVRRHIDSNHPFVDHLRTKVPLRILSNGNLRLATPEPEDTDHTRNTSRRLNDQHVAIVIDRRPGVHQRKIDGRLHGATLKHQNADDADVPATPEFKPCLVAACGFLHAVGRKP